MLRLGFPAEGRSPSFVRIYDKQRPYESGAEPPHCKGGRYGRGCCAAQSLARRWASETCAGVICLARAFMRLPASE